MGIVANDSMMRQLLLNTKGKYMKESNTLAGNASIKQLQMDILLKTKGQYLKESNSLAGNATNKQHQKAILQDTKRKDMRESNNLLKISHAVKYRFDTVGLVGLICLV